MDLSRAFRPQLFHPVVHLIKLGFRCANFNMRSNMTDTTVVSTLTNNSVSFDISGLRHFEEGDKIWFCLFDIGRMLEMEDSAVRKMKSNDWFDSDEINTVKNFHGGADITYVSESALYRIINRSNSPKARPFERWVTKEVLPSIRKTGSYSVTRLTICKRKGEVNSTPYLYDGKYQIW